MLTNRYIKSVVDTSATEANNVPEVKFSKKSRRILRLEQEFDRSIDGLTRELSMLITYSQELNAQTQDISLI